MTGSRFKGASVRYNCSPEEREDDPWYKKRKLSCSAGFGHGEGWSLSTEIKLGDQEVNVVRQTASIRAGIKFLEGPRRTQAEFDLFVPLSFPTTLL